jgi:HAE1 family hydrophobic/amphiphilic exporter-1
LAANGAGAASQKAIGVAVFGGMLAATLIGVILVPVLYALLQSLREWIKGTKDDPGPAEETA